jgi:hypothetical protein
MRELKRALRHYNIDVMDARNHFAGYEDGNYDDLEEFVVSIESQPTQPRGD